MNRKILEILKSNQGKFVSGEDLSRELNVTRAAVWKHINYFKERGYVIESVSKKGYRLVSCPDLLTGEEMWSKLTTKYIGRNVLHFDELDSTSIYAKKIGDSCPDGTVVTCEMQNSGKGRLGRQWQATEGGLYMSVVLKPRISIFEAAKLTQVCAASVSEALAQYGIDTQIKWPNDILLNGRKICGILTEMNSEINKVNYVVIGIGINVSNSRDGFADEVRNVATSILEETGTRYLRSDIAVSVLNCLEQYYERFVNDGDFEASLEVCRKRSSVTGRNINVIRAGQVAVAKATGIGREGDLQVEYEDGSTDSLISGEISIRTV